MCCRRRAIRLKKNLHIISINIFKIYWVSFSVRYINNPWICCFKSFINIQLSHIYQILDSLMCKKHLICHSIDIINSYRYISNRFICLKNHNHQKWYNYQTNQNFNQRKSLPYSTHTIVIQFFYNIARKCFFCKKINILKNICILLKKKLQLYYDRKFSSICYRSTCHPTF